MRAAALVLAIVVAPALGGCLVRDEVRTLPDVAGTVVRGGAPLADVPVRTVESVDDDGAPRRGASRAETRTDARGAFRLAPRDEHDWLFVTGTMDRVATWSLQIFVDGRWVDGWRAAGLAPHAVPFAATCDLDAPALRREISGARGTGLGPCLLSPRSDTDQATATGAAE